MKFDLKFGFKFFLTPIKNGWGDFSGTFKTLLVSPKLDPSQLHRPHSPKAPRLHAAASNRYKQDMQKTQKMAKVSTLCIFTKL